MKRKSGWRPSPSWVAFYAGKNTESGALLKSTTSSGPTKGSAIRTPSRSAPRIIEPDLTVFAGPILQEAFGKIGMALRNPFSRWYETCSSLGHRGILFTVRGQPYSKANSRRVVTGMGGRPMVIKSEKALDYAASWAAQAPRMRFPLQGKIRVYGCIAYASERPDLDESLILDLMHGYIYGNDRQVRQKFFVHAIDTKMPRAIILAEEMEPGLL